MAPGGGVRVAQGVGWWAVSMVWVVACLVGGVLGAVLPSVLVPPTGPYPLPVPPPLPLPWWPVWGWLVCVGGPVSCVGVGGVSPAEGIGMVGYWGSSHYARVLAVRGDGGGCLFGLGPSGRRQWWWLATFPAPVKFPGPATLSAPPKFLVTVRSSPSGTGAPPRQGERDAGVLVVP